MIMNGLELGFLIILGAWMLVVTRIVLDNRSVVRDMMIARDAVWNAYNSNQEDASQLTLHDFTEEE